MIIKGEIEEKFEEYGDAKGYSEDGQDDPEGVLHPNNLVKTPHSSKPAKCKLASICRIALTNFSVSNLLAHVNYRRI